MDSVGINDNFFDLEGDSLLATMIAVRIREHFGANLSMQAVFDGPTVALLAGNIHGR